MIRQARIESMKRELEQQSKEFDMILGEILGFF